MLTRAIGSIVKRHQELLLLTLFMMSTGVAFILTHAPQPNSDGRMYYAYTQSLVLDHDIDFSNQRLAYPAEISPITGKVTNIFSIGAGLLLLPFFYVGHLISLLCSLCGVQTPLDGEGTIYYAAASIGVLFYYQEQKILNISANI